MAVVPVLYTTTNAIRSVIGLDDNDVSDAMILNQNMSDWMQIDLEEFMPDHATDTLVAATMTRVRVWCQLWGALKLITLGPLGIPQRFSANQDELQRYANIDWKGLEERLRSQLNDLQGKLTPTTPSATFSIMGKAVPSYDPITGV